MLRGLLQADGLGCQWLSTGIWGPLITITVPFQVSVSLFLLSLSTVWDSGTWSIVPGLGDYAGAKGGNGIDLSFCCAFKLEKASLYADFEI